MAGKRGTLWIGMCVVILITGGMGWIGQGEAASSTATITITNPSAITATVGDGDDFATRVLRDPWDMNHRRDIGWEVNLGSIALANGLWESVISSVSQQPGFYPLFQGFSTPLSNGLSQELNWNPVGANDSQAISTSKYTQLSFRTYVSQRTQYAIWWTHEKPVNWPQGDQRFSGGDGCYDSTKLNNWPAWHIHNFDLTQANGDAGQQFGSWQAQTYVRGFRIQPSNSAPVGTQVKVDWVRLTDPAKSPIINIEWLSSGAAAGDLVDIYAADNPSGINAAPIYRGIAATLGTYAFKTSVLPPGQWYVAAYLMDGSVVSKGCYVKAQSGYVGPLQIVGAPHVSISAPSMYSGPDYAATERSNAWDMDASSDVLTTPFDDQIRNESLSNGIFSGTAYLPATQTESDSQIWLNVNPSRPINTTRYHYFTIRFKVDYPADPAYQDINEWLGPFGWGGRLIWWNTGIQADGSATKFGWYYEGWRTYSVDLARAMANPQTPQADNILHPPEQDSFPAQLGWTPMGTVKNLRFDPLETTAAAVGTGADQFSIDWVKLTATDEVVQGTPYAIRYQATTSQAPTLTFYYTTNPSGSPTQNVALLFTPSAPPVSPFKMFIPIVARNFPMDGMPGGSAYEWDTSGVAVGTYYICVKADDGVNTGNNVPIYCSEAPVKVIAP